MSRDTNQKNPWLSLSLGLALVFSACLPQGYMLTRGADNLVEIIMCRGFGHESETRLLDLSTGEYVDGPETHQPSDKSDNKGACEFTLSNFDVSELPFGYKTESEVSVRSFAAYYSASYLKAEYLQALSRGPPLIEVV